MAKVIAREEMNLQEGWYAEAKEMDMQKLPEFLRHLTEDFDHDYGTICHALTAGAIATCWAMNATEQGGITGFQAGAVMWEFIRHWMHHEYGDGSLRLINYDDMLYPQYRDRFEKVISKEVWARLQEKAKEKLREATEDRPVAAVKLHWQNIAQGQVPFGYKVEED